MAVSMGIAALGMAAPAAAQSLTVTITDVRSSDGVVRACLTAMESTFPRCDRDPNSRSSTVRSGDTVTIRFDDVAPGEYAIAVLHDENENGKIDRVLGMAPREGYGFSRDAPVRMAPPDWDDAVFEMGGSSRSMTIKMRYFL
ncbi:DUF2141 domain-containing protein [uncultured Erythrobacter sp.]|uniref:DUF2141 domain-containing protein n=1 Tax=uncultured Erythrobacter sp. TaxID=263913 RepID=UPI0026247F59|nr:DUF2141 domain-containing protein [uncultured Erythrobacter sp.]